jgi:hypothetical protein
MKSFACVNVPHNFLSIQSCLLILFGTSSFAQLQNNNWTFGNGCRVNFNGPVSNGALNSFLFSGELFYSDGLTVWGPTKQPIPIGIGLKSNDAVSIK